MNKNMKAVVNETYGSPDVLELKDVPKPSPKANEVLVKIHASAANAADWRLLRADPFLVRFMMGLRKPKVNILGADFAGIVEAVGANVTDYQIGDVVFGDLSADIFGSFAEYVCAPQQYIAHKPENLTFEEAAAVPLSGVTALQGIRDHGQVKAGDSVLIHGSSGGVGTFAVQIAKAMGAEVTAVCSTQKVEQAKALGADEVIDYKKEDFAASSKTYDVVLAVNGSRPLQDFVKALKPQGRYVVVGGSMRNLFEGMILGRVHTNNGKSVHTFTATPNGDDLRTLTSWLNDKTITPVIDRRYKFAQIPDALRYIEKGRASGKIVIQHVPSV